VVVLLVLAALILFLPRSWIAVIGMTEGFQRYRFVAFLVFAGSFIWLATFPIEKQYYLRERKKKVDSLTSDERDALRPFILNNKRTLCFGWTTVAVGRNLIRLGILSDTSTADSRNNPYFAIEAWAFSYLREHPELVGIQDKSV